MNDVRFLSSDFTTSGKVSILNCYYYFVACVILCGFSFSFLFSFFFLARD